ncbi:MAG: tRNA (adenosine(37)-N6)-dimethylallyltransferase MiaA [Candidatus Margulisiibacteriota bacterium]|jgi:tRNA dimethylallyltransferase
MKPLCIIGPTAAGKTAYALELAEKTGAEIISADSMQVFRHMNIGTAKPSPAELARTRHHLIDILDPDEPYSVFDFAQNVARLITEISARNKRVIIVGGTGLYLNALFSGLSFTSIPPDQEFRQELNAFDAAELHERLSKVDEVSARQIHPHNKKRVIRALEVFRQAGKPLSRLATQSSQQDQYEIIGLSVERPELYARIDERVDQMFASGLLAEVQGLLDMGYSAGLQAMQALGYKESIAYLTSNDPDNTIPTLEALKALIKQRTRNFAKRQLTWFRRFEQAKWIDTKELIL